MNGKIMRVLGIWFIILIIWIGIQMAQIPGFENTKVYEGINFCILPGSILIIILNLNLHDGNMILLGMLLTISVSIIIYLSIAWVIISLVSQIVRHQKNQGDDPH
jgi:hypothetical protein